MFGLIADAISDALFKALQVLVDVALLFEDQHGAKGRRGNLVVGNTFRRAVEQNSWFEALVVFISIDG
jgi:hypothetical protein